MSETKFNSVIRFKIQGDFSPNEMYLMLRPLIGEPDYICKVSVWDNETKNFIDTDKIEDFEYKNKEYNIRCPEGTWFVDYVIKSEELTDGNHSVVTMKTIKKAKDTIKRELDGLVFASRVIDLDKWCIVTNIYYDGEEETLYYEE